MTMFDPDAGPMPQFRSLSSTLETNFGTLEFTGGGYPTLDSARKLYDELDLQRATQAYLDFMPALSLYAILLGQVRDYGFKTPSDVGVFADYMDYHSLYLTGNHDTVYAVGVLDMGIDGPTVVEIPSAMYGTADDAYFKYITDFGPTGPDKGEGGKYVFLPPGYDGEVPAGYFVMRPRSRRVWVMMRGGTGTGREAMAYYEKHLKIYPLTSGPREASHINISGMPINTLAPEDGTAFDWLNDIIQYEPSDLFNQEQLGRLASLGIMKGQPFRPSAHVRRILDQGAKQGAAMARAIVYANRDPKIKYWSGRQWEVMFLGGSSEFLRDGYRNIDARTLWHYQAIVVAPALASTEPGVGSSYLTNCRDQSGAYLDGGRMYSLRIPANVPVEQFWSITVYDPSVRSQLKNDQGRPNISSLRDHDTNADGSVDLHFGPTAPTDKEKNWIQTVPGKGWFVVFRTYGPLEPYLDRTWRLNDIVEVSWRTDPRAK